GSHGKAAEHRHPLEQRRDVCRNDVLDLFAPPFGNAVLGGFHEAQSGPETLQGCFPGLRSGVIWRNRAVRFHCHGSGWVLSEGTWGTAMKRYETLAADIEESIRSGVLRSGDRLPSIRIASRHRGISASTVFEAYYLLEARGLVRARAKSGYYVSAGPRRFPPEAQSVSATADDSGELAVSERVFQILEHTARRRAVPLGSAFLSPLLFPLARLGRYLAAAARGLDPWSTVDDLTPGNEALRRQIAVRYLGDGIRVPTDQIVVTNGAMEALNLCLAAVAPAGD